MEDWTDRVYYGGDLPRAAEKALHMAAASWDDPAAAEAWLTEAQGIAPDHRAVKLGHYKYHFYRNNLVAAAPWALACVRDAGRALNLPADWRVVTAGDARFDSLEPEPRFYLYALKAYGYVMVRQGRIDEGLEALRTVAALDPADRTATAGLIALIERGPDPED